MIKKCSEKKTLLKIVEKFQKMSVVVKKTGLNIISFQANALFL